MTPKRVIGIGETVLDILFKDDQPQMTVAASTMKSFFIVVLFYIVCFPFVLKS